MRIHSVSALILGASIASAGLPALAQDVPAPKLNLTGSYEISDVSVSDDSVSLGFKATITNLGEEDVSGQVVLRHPNIIQKVYERFGDQSISAGSSVTVSSNVTIPRDQYDDWQKGGAPALFFNTETDRGEIKVFRVPLSQSAGPKSN